MIKDKKSQRGFTLIEVLVSITLIGIIAVSVMGLFTASLQNNMASKEVITDAVFVKDIMEKVKEELFALPSESRDLNSLINKGNDVQALYADSTIIITSKNAEKKLYSIEVQIPGVREGSVERFVSYAYLP